MRDRVASVVFAWNDGLDVGLGKLLANEVCVVTFVGQERLDPVRDHTEQRAETMDIVGLSWRQDKTKRTSPGVTSGVQFGGETATRSAKHLGFLRSFFIPTAQ